MQGSTQTAATSVSTSSFAIILMWLSTKYNLGINESVAMVLAAFILPSLQKINEVVGTIFDALVQRVTKEIKEDDVVITVPAQGANP